MISTVQEPSAGEVVYKSVTASNTSIVRPSSPEVPDISVISVFCVPAIGEVMDGASGAVWSTVTATAVEAGESLVAASVAIAVKL